MTIVCIRKSLLASLCPVFFGSFDLFLCDKLATVVVLSWQDLRQSTCRGAQSLEQISIREYFYFCRYLMISFHSFPYRSSAARSAVVLPTTTQFGRRAFSVWGPDIWNSLSVDIRLTDSHAAFRRAPKTSVLTSLLFCSLLVSGWTFVLHSCSFFMYDWAL